MRRLNQPIPPHATQGGVTHGQATPLGLAVIAHARSHVPVTAAAVMAPLWPIATVVAAPPIPVAVLAATHGAATAALVAGAAVTAHARNLAHAHDHAYVAVMVLW